MASYPIRNVHLQVISRLERYLGSSENYKLRCGEIPELANILEKCRRRSIPVRVSCSWSDQYSIPHISVYKEDGVRSPSLSSYLEVDYPFMRILKTTQCSEELHFNAQIVMPHFLRLVEYEGATDDGERHARTVVLPIDSRWRRVAKIINSEE